MTRDFQYLQVNDQKKATGSTAGMKRTAETSELFQYRIQKCVKEHVTQMIQVRSLVQVSLFSLKLNLMRNVSHCSHFIEIFFVLFLFFFVT